MSIARLSVSRWLVLTPGRMPLPSKVAFHASARREACEHHASMIRSRMIDRLDDAAHSGLLGEILGDIEPALDACGYDRGDLLQAIQEAIFPEEFFQGKPLSGILPRGGGAGAGEERLLALLKTVARKSNRKPANSQ